MLWRSRRAGWETRSGGWAALEQGHVQLRPGRTVLGKANSLPTSFFSECATGRKTCAQHRDSPLGTDYAEPRGATTFPTTSKTKN